MKYIVTLNDKQYEVEVEKGKAVAAYIGEAPAPAPVAAAPAPAAAPAAGSDRKERRHPVHSGSNEDGERNLCKQGWYGNFRMRIQGRVG